MWLLTLYRSTIGKKSIMAVTGLLLILFVIGHMAGNLQVFLGAAKINSYATFLKSSAEVLWLVRLGLLAAVALHVLMAWQLTRIAVRARPVGYAVRAPQVSTVKGLGKGRKYLDRDLGMMEWELQVYIDKPSPAMVFYRVSNGNVAFWGQDSVPADRAIRLLN